ncbi:coproporphyrinogen-III oxidase family protein [Alistipes indistinctus]|uniref:coproporphyrinogen-III oxidase family protein n=1 Tax=Alistipes indistinctus TaxID=626932 RepID=UPI003AEF2835
MAGVYIHIPFCKSRCHYCDFFSGTSLERRRELLAALHAELELRAGTAGPFPAGEPLCPANPRTAPTTTSRTDQAPVSQTTPAKGPGVITLSAANRIETLYFGGGTPSLLTPHELGDFIRQVREQWPDAPLEEVTVEANPDDLSLSYLATLRREGANRLSIGIQSFLDRDLQWMHRRHDARTAVEAVKAARRAGFGNLSIDLIYGVPQMTPEEWRYNLEQALELQPEHISAYHLTIEPQTPFGRQARRGTLREADPETSRAQFALLREMLCGAGYEHYEVSNFALPERRARHNSHYWDGTPYLGIGPSAHSFDGERRQWNVANLSRYLELLPQGAQCETETLTPDMQYNEYVMTRLRTADGLRTGDLAVRFGARKLQYFLRQAQKFTAAGTLQVESGRYYIPPAHWFISDSVISDLFLA